MSCDTTSTAPARANVNTKGKQGIASVEKSDDFVLSFDEKTNHHRVYFHDPERHEGQTFCWSQPLSMVRLDIPVNRYRVTIDTASVRGDRCKFPFELRWNDHHIAPQRIDINQGKICFTIDDSMFVPNDEQRLTISCRPLSSDADQRQLGLPVSSIRLSPTTFVQTDRVSRDQLGHWMKERSLGGFRQLLGKNAPSPLLPIWSMKLAKVSTQLLPPVSSASTASPETPNHTPTENVVVSCVEINSRHGTGLLIQYLFGDFDNLTTICSQQLYKGERVQSRIHHDLPCAGLDRHEVYAHVLEWFREGPPKRAYVVPFFDSDLLVAIALKDLFGTQICLHFMDDQNIYGSMISNAVMDEALSKADLSFTISPEMRTAYQQKFGHKIYVLPPIVPDASIQKSVRSESDPLRERGILIGNVWDHQWLNRLRKTVRESGFQVDWFCNNPDILMNQRQLSTLKSDLQADGIFLQDALWGEDLIAELRQRPYALMPSGTLDEGEATANIARLSLPSRIPFMISTSRLPVVVLGSKETAAARFVDRFQLGRCVDYAGTQLKHAVEAVTDTYAQQAIRERAASIGSQFSADKMEAWLWESLEQGEPIDGRFESLFETRDDEFAYFIDAKPPQEINWEKRSLWQTLKRLKGMGLQPETIIDAGASNGVWSWSATKVFPDAHYVMIDPLMSHYSESEKNYYHNRIDRYQLVEAALSDKAGKMEFLVSDDLFGSSLLKVNENIRDAKTIAVDVVTLDDLATQNDWSGPVLLKVDVQYAEHLVLAGGAKFIQANVDALILELTIEREHPDAKTYREMLDLMDQLGYRLVDETEGWRTPKNGVLEQKDSVFVRRDLLAKTDSLKEGVSTC